jgi:hypothetical protein
MTAVDIPLSRLHNQRLAGSRPIAPAQAVAWLGALQAQDYASAIWAIGLRCQGATAASIAEAIAGGTIVHTWLLRGTLHFVSAADLRWLLALLGPGLVAGSQYRYRQLGLDEATFARSFQVLESALRDGRPGTRKDVIAALEQSGISTAGQRGYHILARAALEGLICLGPLQGKQQTSVWLDAWVAEGKKLNRAEALAELAARYFGSHGPATLRDFIWWSGLRVADARAGLEMIRSQLVEVIVDQRAYWMSLDAPVHHFPSPTVHLLPAFDEYYLGYSARGAVLDRHFDKKVVSSNGIFWPMIVVDGQVVGTWERALKRDKVVVTPAPFRPLAAAEIQALAVAASQYGEFLGRPAVLARS